MNSFLFEDAKLLRKLPPIFCWVCKSLKLVPFRVLVAIRLCVIKFVEVKFGWGD